MSTFQITKDQYNATVAKVEQANKRAAQKGLAGRLTFEGTPVTVTVKDDITGLDRTYEMVDVAFGGEAPKYGGWTFLATLDWDANAGLVTRTAPGVETVDRSKLVEGFCDHCKTNRQRNMTYLLGHEDGRQVQVGSTCIKDFLGLQVNISWLDSASIIDEFEAGFGGGNWTRDNGTEYVLALAWALIKLDGFRPTSSFNGSTKADVLNVLYPPRITTMEYREWAGRIRELAAEATERAAEVRAFIASDDFAGDSEYVRNLKAVAAADHVSDRNLGLLVSAPQQLAKHQARTLVREAEASMPSEWVGAVKDKLTLTVTIKGFLPVPGDYGTMFLYTLRDEKTGNIFKWFASREALGDKTGEVVTIVATVKKHEEYKGVKSTMVTRAKVVVK